MSTQHASGHHLNVSVGDGLWDALNTLAERKGESINPITRTGGTKAMAIVVPAIELTGTGVDLGVGPDGTCRQGDSQIKRVGLQSGDDLFWQVLDHKQALTACDQTQSQ